MDLSEAQALAARIRVEPSMSAFVEEIDALALWVQKLPAEPSRISCYFCPRPASTMEAGYAVCERMFHSFTFDDRLPTCSDLSDALAGAVDAIRQAIAPDENVPPAPEAPTGVSGHYDAEAVAEAILRAVWLGAGSVGAVAHLAQAIKAAER